MDVEYLKEVEMLCPEKQIFKNYSLAANIVAENVNNTAGTPALQKTPHHYEGLLGGLYVGLW